MQRSDGSQQQQEAGGGSAPSLPAHVGSGTSATQPILAQSQVRVAARPAVVTAQGQAAIGVIPVGQQGVITTTAGFTLAPQPAIVSAGVRPAVASPQAMVVSSQTVSRLLSPSSSLQASNVQLPATLNVLQRQLSAPGVVGLSTVSAQDLQQVLQQASQQSITLLTADPGATSTNTPTRPRLARPLSFSHSSPAPNVPGPPTSSVSATGGTIHHHGQSPVRSGLPVVAATLSHSNLQHSILSMNLNQQHLAQRRAACTTATSTTTTSVLPATAVVTSQTSRTVSEVRAGATPGISFRSASSQPPRKKIKVEEKAPASPDIAHHRKLIADVKHKEMLDIKAVYFENLTEMFFLQSGNNYIDFLTWKKRPTPQLVNFLKSGHLDSDDEEDILQVKEINSEVKVLTNPGSNVPLATPVAISTTLPPMVSALSQQVVAPSGQTVSAANAGGTSTTTLSNTVIPSASTASSTTSQLQLQLSRAHDAKGTTLKGQVSPSKQPKSPPLSPGQRLNTRQQSLSAVYDHLAGGAQEVIVERAKQEAQVMQRVAELRKEGLWTSRRLPRVQEPPRQKAHWDYLLEEMTWLAADFIQERKWKKAAARKLARMVSNYFKEQEQKELRAEKEEAIKLKKIASHMAKMVKEFWTNIEKVVQYKQQTRLEEKKKKALDLHLNFIVDQTEKYSTWLTEGLKGGSVSGSLSTSPAHSSDGGEFEPSDITTDDEETIEKEENESAIDEVETKQELEDLQKAGELPLEDLLKTLPEEVLSAPAPLPPSDKDDADQSSDGEEEEGKQEIKQEEKGQEDEGSDKEFAGTEEAVDEEDTIAEQEKHEKRNYKDELKDLQDEGEMSIEDLAAKYAAAYDSDFEMPQESSSEEESESDSDSDDIEIETESSTDEEEEDEEVKEKVEVKSEKESEETEPGLEALVKPSGDAGNTTTSQKPAVETVAKDQQDMSREDIAGIAEQAQSLQPKGYTLETTEVKTKVPFLLKHSLREYQHVGLDWLATMHEKRLNGILADEMGLGKTIQTIALLAHLACEKSIWGPHLIVVPTSVMLNWEMELKKWCPAFKILTYYGNQKERKLKRQGWTKTNAFHVCITSYKLVVQDHQAFRRKKWKYLILDEAQNIKNFKSQRWQMLLNFSSQRRLLLTGTPLQNSLMELWSLMHFLMPNVFQSHRDFKEWFSNPLTGMIEGSQEYNESLIKRLHKVLRPFLLRRLKNEVEKQMPKKFEHVVMCRLSKRQRFLYDDFMAQAKTKETLESGHYMSVINILMQLRKVCNHPNLFDPRPIVSPFRMEGLVYHTASLAARALQYNVFEDVDLRVLFPNLAEMERDLPAFVSHRVKQLRTANNLIQEIDSQPQPPPRPPAGQLKPTVLRGISPALAQASGRASPVSLLPQARAGSPVDIAKAAQASTAVKSAASIANTAAPLPAAVVAPATATLSQVRTTGGQTLLLSSQGRVGGAGSALILSSVSQSASTATTVTTTAPSTTTTTLQAKVMPQQHQGGASQGGSTPASVLTSQPITVQIQQTEQGTRLMIPTGQLSQLPASLFQIVQTPSGQQLIATSSAAQVSSVVPLTTAVTTTASSTVNGPSAPTTVAATSSLALVTTAVSQVKTIPALSAPVVAASPVPSSPSVVSGKPIMRVSPMVAAPSSAAVTSTSTAITSSILSSSPSLLEEKSSNQKKRLPSVPVKKSEMYYEVVHERRAQRRREKLKRLARINASHCAHTPVYGPDVHHALTVSSSPARPPSRPSPASSSSSHSRCCWLGQGYANCQAAHAAPNPNHPQHYWHHTRRLAALITTPDQHLDQLRDVLDRFVFATPSVISPSPQLRMGHPDPSLVVQEARLEHAAKEHLRPLTSKLNTIRTKATIQFPELRLIQYDCGKLQTLDVLLRQLKTGQHRVLIFTQMTKMLDVLEAFLNYHGHRYLRLDGTTKVEQRQALMDRFNADRRIFCFILSTRSGGIGVNLTGADTVVFYDSDWNPTMDAQAQDRCHRIGQTRDVHIYRLISHMTVEENILKKANQKRLLGDLAIEGGNFTTAFFKEQTIKDLFAQPSGLKALADQQNQRDKEKEQERKEKEKEEKEKEVEEQQNKKEEAVVGKKPVKQDKEANILAAFEQALCKAEDETDAIAATQVKAEQKAELAEFDETIPWDEREAEAKKEDDEMSKAEMELAMLDKELTPIERYAVVLVESQMEDEVAEELKMAEEDMENCKKDWELARLKALKEEEERRAELEDDEMLYTYLRDDAQVFISDTDGSEMPLWAPPTPPQDDNDVYLDPTLLFLYEPNVMAESQLPPVYVRKELKKPRIETITTRKQKQRKEEAPRVPRSLFDRPTSVLLKMRRELKMKNLKAGLINKPPFRPTPSAMPPGKPVMDQSEGHPEWLIHEDWALLQAVQTLLNLPLNLTVVSPAHIPNWDMVAEVVNACSRVYRSVKQCKARYENVIIPREEGRILYDVSPRKQKKTKGIYKTKNNRPMKTSQLYSQDSNSSISLLYSLRFDSVKGMAGKRPATMRPALNNPTLKNPKHAAVLQESGITYDQPLNPMQVAAIRAERIAREKKQSQAAAQAAAEQMAAQRSQQQQQQQQGAVQAVAGVAASAPTVAQAVTGQQLHSLVSVTTPTTIITGAAPKVAVGQAMTAVSIARTLPATGNIVAVTGSLPGVRGQRAVAVHEITTVAGNVAAAQVAAQARATLQPTASASANLTAQLASTQKIMAGTSAIAGATVHQQLAAKSLTQQINLLRPIVRSQNPQAATQPQQLRAPKLSFGQKQGGLLRTMSANEQMALKVRQLQQKQAQSGQLQATQILQGQVQQVGSAGGSGAAPVTLVKSVAAASGASTVPIPVSINVTMGQGQQKQALTASRGATVGQLQQQQQRMQFLHQQRKGVPIQQPQKVTALTGQARGGQIPLIIPPQSKITGHLLHQIVKQQQQQQQQHGLIHTSQPAIITAVTQGQALTPMVAKVSLTTVPHTAPIHTLSAATGSPITVTQVTPTPTPPAGPGSSAHPVATINVAGGSAPGVVKTATLTAVEASQQGAGTATPKVATLSQSLVQLASSPLAQHQQPVCVQQGGTATPHRVLTASPAPLPTATPTAVVVSSTALAQQATPSATHQGTAATQQAVATQLVATPVVSAQAVPPAAAVATVVTQTQQPAGQQLTPQQQQQLKASPYAMRTRNPPKH